MCICVVVRMWTSAKKVHTVYAKWTQFNAHAMFLMRLADARIFCCFRWQNKRTVVNRSFKNILFMLAEKKNKHKFHATWFLFGQNVNLTPIMWDVCASAYICFIRCTFFSGLRFKMKFKEENDKKIVFLFKRLSPVRIRNHAIFVFEFLWN